MPCCFINERNGYFTVCRDKSPLTFIAYGSETLREWFCSIVFIAYGGTRFVYVSPFANYFHSGATLHKVPSAFILRLNDYISVFIDESPFAMGRVGIVIRFDLHSRQSF